MDLSLNNHLKCVDSREPASIRNKLITLGWEQKAMPYGDYSFQDIDYREIGITRKTVSDLIGSIGDRFSFQLEQMLDYYPVNIILIEGSWKNVSPEEVLKYDGELSRYSWDSIWNYLHRWIAKGFILELTLSEEHTVKRLNSLFKLYQKPYSVSARSKDYSDERILAFPSGTRGKSGLNVLNQFKTLQAVNNASLEDLQAIEGVGKAKAQAIYNYFRRS